LEALLAQKEAKEADQATQQPPNLSLGTWMKSSHQLTLAQWRYKIALCASINS